MIPKKAGNYHVEQLQTILLYDAEFNGLLKWLGRQFMMQAKHMNALAMEQYGSRAGLAAIFQSLNMQLFLDVMRQRKIPVAICSTSIKLKIDRRAGAGLL